MAIVWRLDPQSIPDGSPATMPYFHTVGRTLMLRIREVPVSYLGPETIRPDWDFS
jgi:hypothetical protein